MIVIVDYGMGNLGSIKNMIEYLGEEAAISDNPKIIAKATKLILPGVGAFDEGMKELEKRKLLTVLNKKVLKDKIPVLGICLGAQLICRGSEEGKLPGLGWIDADVVKFSFLDNSMKIPHMGWNYIQPQKKHKLLRGLQEEPRYYFVHSYYIRCNKKKDVLATAHYGFDFSAAVQKGNVMGTQFHPEKSHKFGMTIMRNFMEHV